MRRINRFVNAELIFDARDSANCTSQCTFFNIILLKNRSVFLKSKRAQVIEVSEDLLCAH
ncbi:MAG: hypothetical protein COU10_00845 [Candidatus Harrisonbacteria bacterium CG10_big_fil_rev_8_21_14_0_10_45_28]|uniref:Uncharacterized protein n=1 Tax=Candidatus Harrisonbacteria bacterium CG10_big_fil_rev_8_21_14_0_10_45_28 TaxID=1974586 RepID=A0A2H0UNX5_9BACT|nr:MAG: hypothetical protein COU10_00845 [Candidatus Harrisonbacteria bacterium CG10_big_fil_rev_8_21_14_0_10_45_28]